MSKIGSKLAQGVRQVMEQSKAPATIEKEAPRKVIAPAMAEVSLSKPAAGKSMNTTPARSKAAEYEISHPERIWPD